MCVGQWNSGEGGVREGEGQCREGGGGVGDSIPACDQGGRGEGQIYKVVGGKV